MVGPQITNSNRSTLHCNMQWVGEGVASITYPETVSVLTCSPCGSESSTGSPGITSKLESEVATETSDSSWILVTTVASLLMLLL